MLRVGRQHRSAMVGIIDLLAQCNLLGAEEKDPMQWYKCTSPRLRDASTSIKALLDSPYFAYMNNPKTAEIYQALVDPPIEGETNSNPKANFQKIPACQRLGAQQLFSEIRFTEIKADMIMMDDHQPTSEAPTPSGLATRIRDGKPGSPHRKVLGNG
jgi:hypothetical protein